MSEGKITRQTFSNSQIGLQTSSKSEPKNVRGVSDIISEKVATIGEKLSFRRFEVLENEISELNKAIASGDKELIRVKKEQLAYGVAVQTSAEKLDQLDDEAQEHLEALENIDKKSEEYTSTLDELARDVNRAFGSELTGEFFSQDDEKNLKLFKKALEGDQEAWEQFIINADIARLSVADFT